MDLNCELTGAQITAKNLRFITALTIAIFFAGHAIAADPEGANNGLKAEIYAGRDFQKLVCRRIDPNIECFWDFGAPAVESPIDDFSVRWTGWICAPRNGRYKLIFACDDGVRLWINGHQVLNEWKTGAFKFEASVELTEEPQAIRVEYFEATGPAWIVMLWQPTGRSTFCPVPPEALFLDEVSARKKTGKASREKTGLVAEYFDKSFSRRFKADRVVRTEAIWGNGSPDWGVPADAAARYTGVLSPPVSGQYKLIGFADDRMRLWIDDKPIFSIGSRGKSEPTFVHLEANTAYPIRIEHIDDLAWGSYYLHWVPPGGKKELSIPPECLFQNKSAVPKKLP